ncbi:hypothetical protein BDZ91DRAFT_764678 [Kalaharituber pfeilii]|nr:hypothetical protein BDZ91DRAFT_764678 [Kalaharituber pfeilii]
MPWRAFFIVLLRHLFCLGSQSARTTSTQPRRRPPPAAHFAAGGGGGGVQNAAAACVAPAAEWPCWMGKQQAVPSMAAPIRRRRSAARMDAPAISAPTPSQLSVLTRGKRFLARQALIIQPQRERARGHTIIIHSRRKDTRATSKRAVESLGQALSGPVGAVSWLRASSDIRWLLGGLPSHSRTNSQAWQANQLQHATQLSDIAPIQRASTTATASSLSVVVRREPDAQTEPTTAIGSPLRLLAGIHSFLARVRGGLLAPGRRRTRCDPSEPTGLTDVNGEEGG